MFENIAAIDIGTYSVKVVAIKTGFKDFQLKSFAYEEIDLSIENYNDAVKDALAKILKEEDLSDYKIITNLPMEKAIIRNISFPFNDVQKIAEAIPYEAEENIPFKREDLVMDFQPLKSTKETEGRVLLAASHKENIYDFLTILHDAGFKPIKMGMESNAIFECYKYFNKIEEESIIQVDIGNNKSIINIIQNNRLLYARSISIGINQIHKYISEYLKLTYSEAVKLFENLNFDLTSLENNIQRNYYKSLGLSKQKFEKIYSASIEVIEELINQILLTIKALFIDYEKITFSRVLISGGGANISGIGTIISKELEVPVVALPFLEDYKEQRIQTQFPTAFGTVLTYINSRRSSINFLKGEFLPDIASSSRKIYYLAGTFAALSIVVLFINFILSFILLSKANSEYNKNINEKFKNYFHVRKSVENPIAEAEKILKKEKADFETMSKVIQEDSSALDILKDIVSNFSNDDQFELKNFVLNERIIRIDGSMGSEKSLEEFKQNLIKTNKFESVTSTSMGNARFSINIKLKNK